MTGLRVLRIYHAGGDPAHRGRERALLAAGVDVTVVVPEPWPGVDLSDQDVPHRRFAVRRPGDVNRHSYVDQAALRALIRELQPHVVDVHEEPVSLAARQWLRAAGDLPVVMYTAQNLDKRWPPPFAQYERDALRRVTAFYPCSAQAASVLRGKGYGGQVSVLPLGLDEAVHRPGGQTLPAAEVVLGLVGRLVPEKGVQDAVRVLAAVHATRPARLLVIGEGPESEPARQLSADLGVADRCTWLPWCPVKDLAAAYRRMHVVLIPSRATTSWVEQFGRVITEGQANGAVPVGYASGSIPEVTGEAGVLVPEADLEALTRATVALLDGPRRWDALRAVGLEAAAGRSWARVAQEQTALYRIAMSRGAPFVQRPSPRTRIAAREEFGATAVTPAGRRPFALPVLRSPGGVQRLVAAAVDHATRQR